MVQSLKVILWGEEIGRLAWDVKRRLSYFMYNPAFLKKGLNISPLAAPVDGVGLMPVWGEEAKIYQKLPAFLADSLPDAWGNQLFELWRQQNHLSNADITPLDKLSFIGKRGMGALEFLPEVSRERKAEKIDIKSLANLAKRIFSERENARILPEESVTMQSLLTVGTSAGGRQPKVIVAINQKNGEVCSGQISELEEFDYYLIKFGNSQYSSAELEMSYYELATMAGINMMPSKLYQVDGNNHFMTKRFDRNNGKKIHTQTLAAVSPDADSYEQLITVCRKLHLPETDCYEVVRPAFQVARTGNRSTQVIVYFFKYILQGRRLLDTFGHGKTKAVRLSGTVVRILSEDNDFRIVYRTMVECIEYQFAGRENPGLGVFVFYKSDQFGKIRFVKFFLKQCFPGFFNFNVHME